MGDFFVVGFSVVLVVFSALTVLVSQSGLQKPVSVISTSFLLGTSTTCSNSGEKRPVKGQLKVKIAKALDLGWKEIF